MTKFVNKTPHNVTVSATGVHVDGDDWVRWVTYRPEGPAARVAVSQDDCDTFSVVECMFAFEIPMFRESLGPVENLPDPVKGTFYIVSRVVAEAVRGERNDVVYPTNLVRDQDGRIVGCEGFAFA
jgi:hypothetical protein